MGYSTNENTTIGVLADITSDILSEDEDQDGYGLDKDEAEAVIRRLLFNPDEFAEFLYTYHKDFNE